MPRPTLGGMPWLGCWQLWEEQFDQSGQPEGEAPLIDQTSVCGCSHRRRSRRRDTDGRDPSGHLG